MKETRRYETQRDRMVSELAKPALTDRRRVALYRAASEPFKPRGMQTSEARKRQENLTEGKAIILKFRCAEPVSLVPEVPTSEAVINNQRFF